MIDSELSRQAVPPWAAGWSWGGVLGTALDPALANTGPWGFKTVQNADGTFSIVVASSGPKKYNGPGVPGIVGGNVSAEYLGPSDPISRALAASGYGSRTYLLLPDATQDTQTGTPASALGLAALLGIGLLAIAHFA